MTMPIHISHTNKKGFTLIELLIVVGILGILAAGLLAALNPLEQLRKGRDTTKRNISVEYNNALARYFAVKGYFPWEDAGYVGADPNASALSTQAALTDALQLVGELKTNFEEGLGTASTAIFVTGTSGPTATTAVCFNPESTSISSDPSTVFTNAGATLAGCPDPAVACFWCAK